VKKSFAVLVFLSAATVADAQFVKGIGIKVGTTIANQVWHYTMYNSSLLKEYAQGTFCSVNAEFLKGKNFTFITEVAYSQKGCEEGLPDLFLTLPANYSTYRIYDTRFNYLSSSILLKARFENVHWIPYGFVGPRLDYQLSYASDFNFKPLEIYMNKNIWGIDYGLGIEYKIFRGGVSAEFRHHFDFDNMLEVPTADNHPEIQVKSNAYIFNLGIKYYFKNPKKISVKPA